MEMWNWITTNLDAWQYSADSRHRTHAPASSDWRHIHRSQRLLAAFCDEGTEQPGPRHFIERTFQNSKSHLGMADYQVRKWQAWHRHMAKVALAGQIVMEERMFNREEKPLLSTRDIVQILHRYFRARQNIETVMKEIENHRRRQAAAVKLKLEKSRRTVTISITL